MIHEQDKVYTPGAIAEVVRKQVVSHAGVRECDPHDACRFTEDAKMDQLDVLAIVVEIEDELDMDELPDDVVENIRTVGQLIAALSHKE